MLHPRSGLGACALGLALMAAAPGARAEGDGPSFDCARAESSAEKLICADPAQAALDREVARLYRLAVEGPHMDAERLATLKPTQRGWIKGRDDCWKADDLATCLRAEQAIRIHALRQGYADARMQDAAGISTGPFVAACPGLDARVGLTFIDAGPGLAVLHWAEATVVLPQGRSASGARYAAEAGEAAPWLGAGEILFWVKGDEARFELPGREAMICGIEEPG